MVKLIVPVGIAVVAATFAACGTEDGNGGGSGGAGGAATCNVDYTRLSSHPMVSFSMDLMPIFDGSCGLSTACHDFDDPEAELSLGNPCNKDETGMCEPLTQELIDMAYASITSDSRTVAGLKRIAPNDPANSFLLDKIANTHNTKGYTCEPQGTGGGPCGADMPPATPLCTQPGGQARFDMIAAWVLQGALNN